MKVGDLVQWYTEYADCTTTDLGLVIEVSKVIPSQVRIRWNSGDEDSWFEMDHPNIGVLSESR